MAKYHINPETGNANLCHAKKKCRFQREGEPPVEHYATKEEAQAAYERQQGQALPPKLKRGRPLTGEDYMLAHRMQETATILVEELELNGYSKSLTAFGGGEERQVFLDRSRQYVYKVYNNYPYSQWADEAGEEAEEADALQQCQEEQYRYAAFSAKLLEEENAEYVEQYYLEALSPNGYRVPVVVQKYLDEEDYSIVPSPSREQLATLMELGITDVTCDNFRQRKSDGKLVLFDCLYGGKNWLPTRTE